MTIIEIDNVVQQLTWRQRWSNYLAIMVSLVLLGVGISLRSSVLNAVQLYTNTEAGISGFYPQSWLLDTSGDYVFRVRDMSYRGFKTTIQVNVLPVSTDTTEQNVFNSLTLNRSTTLANYNVLAIDEYILPDETVAAAMSYTFVGQETGITLEGTPFVVLGLDILTIRRGQAIVITFQAEANIYSDQISQFERFLRTLDFD